MKGAKFHSSVELWLNFHEAQNGLEKKESLSALFRKEHGEKEVSKTFGLCVFHGKSKGGIDVEMAWQNIIASIMWQISSMLKVT